MEEGLMRRLIAAAIAFTTLTVSALAADLPVRPYAPPVVAPLGYNWNGFYIGAHLGGAWASRDFNQTIAGAALVEAGTNKPSGIMGGGQVGYNWQVAPNWLLGVEADVSGADLKDTVSTTSPGGPGGGAGIGAFAVNEGHLTIDTVRAGVNFLFN